MKRCSWDQMRPGQRLWLPQASLRHSEDCWAQCIAQLQATLGTAKAISQLGREALAWGDQAVLVT